MPRRIDVITKDLPFNLFSVVLVFFLSIALWLLGCFIFSVVSWIFVRPEGMSVFKQIIAQPQILELYLLIYCVTAGLLTWFLLIKRIKGGLGFFFSRKKLKKDLRYGFDVFIRSLGITILFFMLIVIAIGLIAKVTGLSFDMMKDSYTQGRQQEIYEIYKVYKFDGLLLFLIVFFAPFYEEIFYRGCLQTALRKRFTPRKAIIYSSLLFALIHGYFFNFFFVLLLGLLLAYSYEKRGSLTAPLVLHFCWNTFSALFMLLKI